MMQTWQFIKNCSLAESHQTNHSWNCPSLECWQYPARHIDRIKCPCKNSQTDTFLFKMSKFSVHWQNTIHKENQFWVLQSSDLFCLAVSVGCKRLQRREFRLSWNTFSWSSYSVKLQIDLAVIYSLAQGQADVTKLEVPGAACQRQKCCYLIKP